MCFGLGITTYGYNDVKYYIYIGIVVMAIGFSLVLKGFEDKYNP